MASYSVVTSSGQTLVNILHRVRGLSSNSRKARSPSVDRRTGGTTRAVERRRRRPSTSAARRCPPRGTARPCRSDNAASEHRGGSVSALELTTSGGRG